MALDQHWFLNLLLYELKKFKLKKILFFEELDTILE